MNYGFFRKKRVFALLLAGFLLILFYNTEWLGHFMYPVKYEEQIRTYAEKTNTDPYLIAAIVKVESNSELDKISSKGAVGLMQLMPDTANWIASGAGYETPLGDKLLEPDMNIEIGAMYVKTLTEQFDQFSANTGIHTDKLAVIAASYNAGPGNVGRWLESGEWTGFYDDVNMIPYGETRHFVQRIVYYYKKYEMYYKDDWER